MRSVKTQEERKAEQSIRENRRHMHVRFLVGWMRGKRVFELRRTVEFAGNVNESVTRLRVSSKMYESGRERDHRKCESIVEHVREIVRKIEIFMDMQSLK